jgi:hypothetical protein
LKATSEHARRFPDGVLAEEREAIAIEALVAAGRGDPARARFTQFVARFPDSSYRRHLERLLGGAGAGADR